MRPTPCAPGGPSQASSERPAAPGDGAGTIPYERDRQSERNERTRRLARAPGSVLHPRAAKDDPPGSAHMGKGRHPLLHAKAPGRLGSAQGADRQRRRTGELMPCHATLTVTASMESCSPRSRHSWQAREPLTAFPTALSSPPPDGSRPASMITPSHPGSPQLCEHAHPPVLDNQRPSPSS